MAAPARPGKPGLSPGGQIVQCLRKPPGGSVQDRTDVTAALKHWPTLARRAGLPEAMPEAEPVLSRSDVAGARVVLTLTLADGRRLVLKEDRAGGAAAAQFSDGIAAQERARFLLSGNTHGLRVPKVLAHLPEAGVALMEHMPGETAAALLEAAPGNPERRAILNACGRWLAEFHRSSSDGCRPYRTRFALDHQRKLRADMAAGALRVAEPWLFLRLSHAVEAAADLWEGRPARHAQRHGDFSLRNLLIAPGRVAAIDFRSPKTAPVGHDVARLLVDFAALFAEHRKIPDGHLLQGPYRTAFVRGYDFAGADDASIGFLYGIQILQDWQRIPADEGNRSLLQIVRLQGLVTTAMRLFPALRRA
jgi:aminoglycoside phosphotransferase (APT) family kinase protein